MEILTASLSLEYQIWFGCISRLRARGSERDWSTPSGFLVGKVAENLQYNADFQQTFPKLQTLLTLSSLNRFGRFERQSCEIFRRQRVGELG